MIPWLSFSILFQRNLCLIFIQPCIKVFKGRINRFREIKASYTAEVLNSSDVPVEQFSEV
jgi:hypothetical protein